MTRALHVGHLRGPSNRVERTRKGCHMARLIGVDLPRDKRLEVALTYISAVSYTHLTLPTSDLV